MKLDRKALVAHHLNAGTPLYRLGNVVRYFEDKRDANEGKPVSRRYHALSRVMRRVVTDVFVARFTSGEYQHDGMDFNEI